MTMRMVNYKRKENSRTDSVQTARYVLMTAAHAVRKP